MTYDDIVKASVEARELRQSLSDYLAYLREHGAGDRFERLVDSAKRIEVFMSDAVAKPSGLLS